MVGDVEDAADPARAARIPVILTGFDDRTAQAEFGGADGRTKPRKAAADCYQIEAQAFANFFVPRRLKA